MGWARAQGTTGISGFAAPQGEGHGFDPAQGCEGMWLPTYLGSSLAAWYKADAGCFTDAACLFASASSQYLSKTSPTFAPTTKMTIRFWVKSTDNGNPQVVASRWGGNQNQFVVAIRAARDIAVFMAGDLTEALGTNSAVSTSTLSDGVAYEVVVVYDGTLSAADRVKIYIDGTLDAVSIGGTIPTTLTASTADITIGNVTSVWFLNGALARLGFSSLALSGAALTAAHTSTFWASMTAARQADWFSFYNLCEASSTRVDSTGLNNLTPTNGPTVAAGPGEGLAVNNSPVKRIEDQSGAGLHATQATITKQGLWIASAQNGRPGILLDGADDYYDLPSMTYGAFTKVLAMNLTTSALPIERADGGSVSDYLYRNGYAWSHQTASGQTAYDDTATGAAWMDGSSVITHRSDGTHAGHIARKNGAVRAGTSGLAGAPTSAAQSAAGTLGGRAASLFCAGHFMEVILASAALSDPQTVSAESYLNTRYAIY